jgi:DnaJ-domain-containing protein 1
MKTATEFWTEKFGEKPKTDSEKLACAMMHEYAEYHTTVQLGQMDEYLEKIKNRIKENC